MELVRSLTCPRPFVLHLVVSTLLPTHIRDTMNNETRASLSEDKDAGFKVEIPDSWHSVSHFNAAVLDRLLV